MKIAITTLGCPDWSFEEVLTRFEEYGVDGIEVRGLDGEMDAEKIKVFFPENAEDTLARVKAHHLELVGFGSSCYFHEPDANEHAFRMQLGKNSIDVCSRMKIPFIRVMGDFVPEGHTLEEITRKVIDGIRELCIYSADKNVDVYLETHGTFKSIETIQPILEALKEFPNFGILWDIEHSDTVYGDDIEAFYEMIFPFLRHLHVKNHIRAKGDTPKRLCSINQGDIPIPKIISWLKRDGFDGCLALEWEKKYHPELDEPEKEFPLFVEYIKTLL